MGLGERNHANKCINTHIFWRCASGVPLNADLLRFLRLVFAPLRLFVKAWVSPYKYESVAVSKCHHPARQRGFRERTHRVIHSLSQALRKHQQSFEGKAGKSRMNHYVLRPALQAPMRAKGLTSRSSHPFCPSLGCVPTTSTSSE